MMKYKLTKHNDYYVLYRYIYKDKSIGFYKVVSGCRKEILKYIENKNIKVGVNYE